MSTTDSPPVDRRKSVLKKSSVAESSPTSSAQASPLRTSINSNLPAVGRVNDDMAEKAARRKSAHFGDLAENGGKDKAGGNGPSGAGQKRAVSALQVQAQQQANQAAGITGLAGNGKRNKRLSAVAPAAPVVSMEVMNTNFEEWMKLATDNKITANNTWNFALIDYFADLTLLRNDEDQSINFQKASCTLDGCVKIWTSRVDSVATETGKLLSGLAGGGGEDVDEEGAEGEEDEDGEPVKKIRKTARSEATLAKSFSTLQVKKFDLEFTVDPLFKKTCADFDEGGAMGLLMNHLGVDGKGRVVFDAGDAGADVEEEEGIEEEEDEMVDLTKLRTFMPSMAKTMSLEISDTLSAFKFSSDPDSMPDFATLVGLKDDFEGPSAQLDEFNPTGEAHDFFGDEDFDAGGGMGGGGFDDSASMGGYDDQAEGFAGPSGNGGGLAMVGSGEGYGPFDPRRQGGELVMALVPGQDEDGMFDYFDKGFGKSWAGAEHWKLKKVSRKDAAAAAPKVARTAKAPFTIDFNAPSTAATSSKTLFAPAPRSSLTLPSAAKAARRRSSKRSIGDAKKRKEEWLLPDDMHFSSRQLLRLFLKPKFALRMRRNGSSPLLMENANGEIDENFWAQAAADRVDFDETADPGDNAPIPFESQFFHDDVDDAFVDDQLDGGSPGMMMDIPGDEDDLWAGTQGQELKKSRPENVHFAKKAKRVDVKRLKDDIWSGLKTLVPDTEGQTESEDETVQPTTPTKDVAPVKTFDAIIQNLRTTYPQEKMSEISTSFCFICLLHLANEEGLMIETARYDGQELEDVGCMGVAEIPEDAEEMENGELMAKWRKMAKRMDQGEKTDRIVGELQALKVYKDPTAGRAA